MDQFFRPPVEEYIDRMKKDNVFPVKDQPLIGRISNGEVPLIGDVYLYKYTTTGTPTSLNEQNIFTSASLISVFTVVSATNTYATNLNNGKPEAGIWALCYGVRYLSGIYTTNGYDADLGTISTVCRWGDIGIRQSSGNIILPKGTPTEVFNSENNVNDIGAYYLPERQWVKPDDQIIVEMNFAAAITTKTVHYIELMVVRNAHS